MRATFFLPRVMAQVRAGFGTPGAERPSPPAVVGLHGTLMPMRDRSLSGAESGSHIFVFLPLCYVRRSGRIVLRDQRNERYLHGGIATAGMLYSIHGLRYTLSQA